MKIVFNLTIIYSLLVCLPFAHAHAGKWVTSKSLDKVTGVEQVMVKTERLDEEVMKFVYSVPVPKITPADNEAEEIRLGNAPSRGYPGKPVLPVIPVRFILPFGRALDIIEVEAGEKIALKGTHLITHGKRAYPISHDEKPAPTARDKTVYGSDEPYPNKLYELVGVQRKRGVSLLLVNLSPVVYLPKSGRLKYYETLTITIQTTPAASDCAEIAYRPDPFIPIQKSVENPQMIASYKNTVKLTALRQFGALDPDESYQYVLITSQYILDNTTDPSVTDFITHKQSRGLTAKVVTTEEIYANYDGTLLEGGGTHDNQARIRDFIYDAYNNWETDFVLLGGDTNVIPERKLRCRGYDIDSDLYYQCLDGTYNYNNNVDWGEDTDGTDGNDVDLMAEVYIGRAPAENVDEMSNFIYKTMAYENEDPDADYLHHALMVGQRITLDRRAKNRHAKNALEEIRIGSSEHGYTTRGFDSSCGTVSTLYEKDGNWEVDDIVAKINSNKWSVFSHFAHAKSYEVMKITNDDVGNDVENDVLTNDKFLFIYSQGCNAGRYSLDCIAERLTTSNRHGCFSVVMNSDVGLRTPNATDGPNQRFAREFFDAHFGERIRHFGAMNADSHEDNWWNIGNDDIRWCYYITNLLGDPETVFRFYEKRWWPMFHLESNHGGSSTSPAPITNNISWSYPTGSDVSSSPAAVYDKVYVGSEYEGYVYCLDAETGALIWSYQPEFATSFTSSPAVVHSKVYVGSGGGYVYCLDAEGNGDETTDRIWEYFINGSVKSSPAVADGRVYVGSWGNGRVYCLDAEGNGDGTTDMIWSYPTGYPVNSSPAVAYGKVYVGGTNGKVYCLDTDPSEDIDEGYDDPEGVDYDLIWSYTTGDNVDSSPAVYDGKVYVGSDDGKIYCLNASTGAWIWEYPTGGDVDSSPAVYDGKVYVGSDDGKVYCLNASTGAWIWEYPTGGDVDSSPAVADGKVYVGSDDEKVYCLNASTGAWIWEHQTGGAVDSSPAVAYRKVYLGSRDDTVYAFGNEAIPADELCYPDGGCEGYCSFCGTDEWLCTDSCDPSCCEIDNGENDKWCLGLGKTWEGNVCCNPPVSRGGDCCSNDDCPDGFSCDSFLYTCWSDLDGDGVLDDGNKSGTAGDNICDGTIVSCDDNCPFEPNGPDLGTCYYDSTKTVVKMCSVTPIVCETDEDCPEGETCSGVTCTSDGGCGTGESCSMNQEDSNHDGIGDVCFKGDVNNDGEIDSDDVQIVINFILGIAFDLETLSTSWNRWAADYNNDGEIDIVDLQYIINIIHEES